MILALQSVGEVISHVDSEMFGEPKLRLSNNYVD